MPFPSSCASRGCRAFRTKLTTSVNQSVDTWRYIFGLEAPRFEPDLRSCADALKSVKAFLLACPSEDQEAIFAWHSFKKLLPDSCRCMEGPLLQNVAKKLKASPRQLPKGYLRFVKRRVAEMFPFGWDSDYERCVTTCTPSLSACLENRRSAGGAQGFISGGHTFSHGGFLDGCLNGVFRPLSVESQMTVVQSAGKPRPLSKFSSDALYLRPLHGAIYDHLSKFPWLNRGDFTTDSLKKAGFSHVTGEVLTSGDYESATDGLSIEVAEIILRTLLDNSVSVPGSIKHYAMSILRPVLYSLEHDIEPFTPSTGQMMGSYLSFPLLCIQNRLAFLFAGGTEEMPCLINGDDILFRSSPEFSQRWMSTVDALGLKVEQTKTSVSEEYGSLNSTLCRRKSGRYVVVPTLRFGMFRDTDQLASLRFSFSDFISGIHGHLRYRAASAWFSRKIGKLRGGGLSILDLGFRGSLAYRMSKKFSLPRFQSGHSVPELEVNHGITLSPECCEWVDYDSVTDECRELSFKEMASWKFSAKFNVQEIGRAELRLCLKISQLRRDRPSFRALLWGHDGGELSGLPRRCFDVPIRKKPRLFPLFVPRQEPLPTYEDALGEIAVDPPLGVVKREEKDRK